MPELYGGHSRPIGHWCPRDPTRADLKPNIFNDFLECDATMWAEINRRGGLQEICATRHYPEPPWIKMPAEGKRLNKIGSISLPAADDVDYEVLSFRISQGFDGCVATVSQSYQGGTGAAFVAGDGQLIWRIKRNATWVRDFANTDSELGNAELAPWANNAGVFFLQSGDFVQYFVNRSSTATPTIIGGRISCAIFGWTWPR